MNILAHRDQGRELLHAVGRNVVKFQRLERALKTLLTVVCVHGTPTTVEKLQRRTFERVSRLTLGQAFNEWKNHLKGIRMVPDIADLYEPWFYSVTSFKATPELITAHLESLEALVKDRNVLIHHELASVDFNSGEKMCALIEKLNDQDTRVTEHLENISDFFGRLIASAGEFQTWVDSEEGAQYFLSLADSDDA